MRLVFAGTPAFAVPSFEALYERFGVCAVLTQPDRPKGRKGILTPSPVKEAALLRDVAVLQPEKLKEDYTALKALNADIMVTCAYGQILTKEVLELFPLGVWNVHASLLPAYRGAAPIARAIINGEHETGITVMKTDIGLDTGAMLLSERIAIDKKDTAGTLTEALSLLGAQLIVKGVERIERGEITLIPQGEGTVCKKVNRTEVDFSRSAIEVSALIRGLSPQPLAYGRVAGITLNFLFAEEVSYEGSEPFGTVLCENPKEGLLVKCGTGAVRITTLQPAGGKVMSARDFLNGRKLQKGSRFDEPVL